jgi:cell wall-associated NlpC family hydrolase
VGDTFTQGLGVKFPSDRTNPFLKPYPKSANILADKDVKIPYYPVVNKPQPGDIVSFPSNGIAHTGIFLGNDLYMSASDGSYIGRKTQLSDGLHLNGIPANKDRVFRAYNPNDSTVTHGRN